MMAFRRSEVRHQSFLPEGRIDLVQKLDVADLQVVSLDGLFLWNSSARGLAVSEVDVEFLPRQVRIDSYGRRLELHRRIASIQTSADKQGISHKSVVLRPSLRLEQVGQ